MSALNIIGWGIFRKDGTLAKCYYPDCEASCSSMELAQFMAERCRDDYNGEVANAKHQPYSASAICNAADIIPKIEWLTVMLDVRADEPYHWSWGSAVGRIVFSARKGVLLEVVYAPKNKHFHPKARRSERVITYKPDQLRKSTPEEIAAAGVTG